jgi:hypothetical protein
VFNEEPKVNGIVEETIYIYIYIYIKEEARSPWRTIIREKGR